MILKEYHRNHNLIIYNGDCLDVMISKKENSIDSIVTDPPYGLKFMNKKWDYQVPSVDIFKECLRVLKPGGYLLSFGGTRTQHRLVCNIEDAGFEIRDMIMWVYGSGFPKSLDVGKAIDKAAGAEREIVSKKIRGDVQKAKERGVGYLADPANRNNTKQFGYGTEELTAPSTDAAKEWEGWGTALKPAVEPICMARKPLIGTVAENVLKHGTGGLNIDGCRVELNGDYKCKANGRPSQTGLNDNYNPNNANHPDTLGRWPANLILSHHPECEMVGMKKVKNNSGSISGNEPSSPVKNTYGKYDRKKWEKHAGPDGTETVENWNCHPDCPIGRFPVTQASKGNYVRKTGDKQFLGLMGDGATNGPDGLCDSGSAARFFYCAKASRKERDAGLEDIPEQLCGTMEDDNYPIKTGSGNLRNTKRSNTHPTVKPISLMQYLCRFVTPPGGTVLDPFMGSGSTGIAALAEGFKFVGIEKDLQFCEISKKRILNNT